MMPKVNRGHTQAPTLLAESAGLSIGFRSTHRELLIFHGGDEPQTHFQLHPSIDRCMLTCHIIVTLFVLNVSVVAG